MDEKEDDAEQWELAYMSHMIMISQLMIYDREIRMVSFNEMLQCPRSSIRVVLDVGDLDGWYVDDANCIFGPP